MSQANTLRLYRAISRSSKWCRPAAAAKVLLIKESYGNALAPFLLDTFSEVYVLDPRQESIQGMNIPSFVENNGIDTVLFCNYTMVPSNSKYMNALNAMIGA